LKILIIRFSSIGDLILTTPLFRCIAHQKNAEIHHLVKPAYAFVLEANPYIQKKHLLDENIIQTVKKLSAENFDVIIDLQNNVKSRLITTLLGRKTVRLNKINIRKWLSVQFKNVHFLPQKHLVDRIFEAVYPLGITNDGKGLDYFLPERFLQLPKGIVLPENYIALVPGGSYYTKQIPPEICKKITEHFPQRFFVMLGDKKDAERMKNVQQKNVLNLCGKLHFHESVRIVKNAEAVITSDTGLMHAAAAFKKKIFSIWGNTIPGFGMYPYLPAEGSRMLEVKGLSCRPCSKLGFSRCPRGHFRCMKDQNVGEITL